MHLMRGEEGEGESEKQTILAFWCLVTQTSIMGFVCTCVYLI